MTRSSDEKVLDPACGTGGFLTSTIEHIREKYVNSVDDHRILQESISGVEKKQLPHLLCITNMLLHGIEVPSRIRHDNTLARPLRDYTPKDRVDVIVTNPPFGGNKTLNDVSKRQQLKSYSKGKQSFKIKRSQGPDLNQD